MRFVDTHPLADAANVVANDRRNAMRTSRALRPASPHALRLKRRRGVTTRANITRRVVVRRSRAQPADDTCVSAP